jgi:outer membrane protein, heavy metal efflux system
MRKIFVVAVFVTATLYLAGQNNIENILISVAKNNKTLLSTTQLLNALKREFKSGLTPGDPKVEYDYLPGSPAGAGVQQNFDVTQSFDFPTAYLSKRAMANEQIAKSELEFQLLRQEILLEAKMNCLSLIYLNKKQSELLRRVAQVDQLYQAYQSKMKGGEATILDVNKAQLLLLNLKTELALNESEMRTLQIKLTELNGGTVVNLTDTIYPSVAEPPEFARLDSMIEANDILLKVFTKEKDISAARLEVVKGLALPRMEVGYHSQAILGQRYQGVHLGIVIPLWQNKNTIKAQKENVIFSNLKIAEHKNEHFHENKKLYEKYIILKSTLAEYNKIFSTSNNSELLSKSLKLGELSTIEFFMELSYFYNSFDSFLEAERDYFQTVAELNKYQL